MGMYRCCVLPYDGRAFSNLYSFRLRFYLLREVTCRVRSPALLFLRVFRY